MAALTGSDATRDAQRGRLRDLYIGDYKRVLVLKPGNDALSDMTVSPESMPTESVVDTLHGEVMRRADRA